jgi:hypothetical protein
MLPQNPQDPNKPNQPTTGAQQPAQAPAASSGRFTNLQKYMRANAPGELAGKVSGRIEQSAQQAGQKINEAAQAFQQAAQQNRLATGQNKQFAQQQIQQAGQGEVSEQDAQKFQGIASGGYRGPSGLQNAQSLAARAQSAESLGRATATEGGRQAVLGQLFGRSSYGAGQQKLDTLLLGAEGGLQQLRQARARAQGLSDRATQEAQKAEQLGQAYRTEDEGFRQKVQEDLTGSARSLDTSVAERVRALNESAPQELAAAQAELKAFQESGAPISQKTADLFGLSEGTSTYGADLAGLVRQGQQATKTTAATAEEARRAQALAKLGGNVVNLQDLSGTYDPTKAASYRAIEADTAGLDPLLQDAQSQYQRDAEKRRSELLGWTGTFGGHVALQAAKEQKAKDALLSNYNAAIAEGKTPEEAEAIANKKYSENISNLAWIGQKQLRDETITDRSGSVINPFAYNEQMNQYGLSGGLNYGGWEGEYAQGAIRGILSNLARGDEDTVLGAENLEDIYARESRPRELEKQWRESQVGKSLADREGFWQFANKKAQELQSRKQAAYDKWDTSRQRKVTIGPAIQNIISGGQ